jgi:hypothetical protein|tara:strand:+ start:1126 stop:1383 length:258 start_codon:yes stop_codon:yes gene_type:complete
MKQTNLKNKDLETIVKIQEKIIKAKSIELKEYKNITKWMLDKYVDLSMWNSHHLKENIKLYKYGKSLTRVLMAIGKKKEKKNDKK